LCGPAVSGRVHPVRADNTDGGNVRANTGAIGTRPDGIVTGGNVCPDRGDSGGRGVQGSFPKHKPRHRYGRSRRVWSGQV